MRSLEPAVDPVPSEPTRWSRTVAVAVVIVVLAAAGVLAWRATVAERSGPLSPGAARGQELFADLPAALRPPARVPDLPNDRGVGRAALIYNRMTDVGSYDADAGTFDQNDVYLVTASGEHFRVGRTPPSPGPLNLSLSPDGRWLGAKRGDQWRVRDLSGTAEYEVPDAYELWLWSTDARSVLLANPGVDGRRFSVMALPGGGVRLLEVRTPAVAVEVAFIAGRELAVFDATPLFRDPAAPEELSVTLQDVVTGATRTLSVVSPGQLRPGETAGPLYALWHAGGSPPSIWVEVGRQDLVPTDSPEGMPVVPTVALLGVDVASGTATTRIEAPSTGADGAQLCRGVVVDGVVLQRWTADNTELTVVDPRRNVRRVVTTISGTVIVLAPGTTR